MASEMGGDEQCFLLHQLLYLQQQDEIEHIIKGLIKFIEIMEFV